MKKAMILALAAAMVFTLIACRNSSSSDATHKGTSGSLVVDGKVTSTHVTVYPEYATLPLCDVISALGFELSRDGTDRASFLCNDVKYEICISEKTLTREGSNENHLICAPGNTYYVCCVTDGDLVIDSNTLHSLLRMFLNYPIDITVDGEKNRVTIKPLP